MTARQSAGAAYERLLGRRMRSVSMATWLALSVLAITVASILVATAVSLSTGSEVTDDVADGQLTGRAALRADQVEQYLRAIQGQVGRLGSSSSIAAASARFIDAYDELGAVTVEDSVTREVAFAYRDDFVPTMEEKFQTSIAWQDFVPVDDSAIYLQEQYVVSPELESGELRFVDDAGDGSAWSEVHGELHRDFLEITERLNLQDLLIVEADRGVVVYSTAKGLDFATSLEVGPHSGSTMATLVRRIRDNPQAGEVSYADFVAYTGQSGQPVAFFATPVFDDERLAAVLVAEFTPAGLTSIMTASGRAGEAGSLGETGEVYIVARDGRMRSDSRLFHEDQEQFLVDVAAADSATESERSAMVETGTTAVFQQAVLGDDVDRVFDGPDEAFVRNNYTNREVITAAELVDFEGLEWAVVSEIAREESDQAVVDFRRNVLIAVAIFVIGVSFFAVGWAGSVFQPLRALGDRLRRIHDGDAADAAEPPPRGAREFAELAASVDATIRSLQNRGSALEAAVQQRLHTVRSLLPPAIAERVEAGDRQVLDHVPQAGIVVLIIDGLGDTSQARNAQEHRRMLERVVEELDSLAEHHGLERVKIVGDAYFAGCGLTEPYLDYAPRSVRFAMDAQLALRAASSDSLYDLDLSAGVHVGPVTTGLAGSARLVYDLWGDTVAVARELARSAPRGAILVSESAKSRLPSDVEVAESPVSPEAWEIIGYHVADGATQ